MLKNMFLYSYVLYNFFLIISTFEFNNFEQKLLSLSLFNQAATEATVPTVTINATEIDSLFNKITQCVKIPAVSLAIVQTDTQGNIIKQYSQGYGKLDPTNPDSGSANADTRFCIGSISKQFTAALVGQVLHQNEQNALWDTPLEQLLGPQESSMYSLPAVNNQLFTLRDLLAHRTGIPRYDFGWVSHPNVDRTKLWQNIHYLKPILPLAGRFRSSFEYNNWFYSLAGYIAQKWDNRQLQWEDLIRMNYFQPLEMTNSTFMHMESKFDNWALPGWYRPFYNSSQKGWAPLNKTIFKVAANIAPAGAICTSANDMVKYLTYLNSPSNASPLLPPKWIVKQAQTPSNVVPLIPTIRGKPALPVDVGVPLYGFGWFQGVYRAYRTISHGGGYFGYLSQLIQFPDLNLSIFVSTTNDPFLGAQRSDALAYAVFDMIMQKQQWLTPALLCTPSPPLHVNITGFAETCSFPIITKYLQLRGQYNHPLFGSAIVTQLFGVTGKMQIRLEYGSIAHGLLCQTTIDGPYTFRLKLDSSSPFAALTSTKMLSKVFGATVTFNMNHVEGLGFPANITMSFIEPRAPASAVTFYPMTYTACSTSNFCQNGGACISNGQYDYSCKCLMWFTGRNCEHGPKRDCTDLIKYYGYTSDGIYWIHPTNGEPMQVYCDMTTDNAGFTLIQRRVDDSVNFTMHWRSYLNQIGNLTENYWMGLMNIWLLTSMQNTNYTIRVDLWDCDHIHAWEEYDNFWLSDATDKFRFHVTPSSARGTANDGFTFGYNYFTQQGMQFSTYDQDNDNSPYQNCAQEYSGGWWYNGCYAANLNGVYKKCGPYSGTRNGIEWIPWKFSQYSLGKVEIKIKRIYT